MPAHYNTFEETDPYLLELRKAWDDNIRQAFNELPSLNRVFEGGE